MCMVGAGAAGVAVRPRSCSGRAFEIAACDRHGAIHTDREDYDSGSMNSPKVWLAENTNPQQRSGSIVEALEGADLFIGLSGPGIIQARDLERMNSEPFVFAMANPESRGEARGGGPYVRVMATGRRLPQPDQQRARLPACSARPTCGRPRSPR